MSEFKVRCGYSMKRKEKFYNDRESQEYHYFVISNPEIIPKEYLAKKEDIPFIVIPESLIKKSKINLEEVLRKGNNFKFIINLGGEKTAKFNTNNRNLMVLKTKEYWENTVQKIGFWDSEDYFYEPKKETKKPIPKSKSNSDQSENKNKWGKIILFCLPIIILALFSFLIIRWVSKKKKKKN